jgi:chemotaxis protein methyltransferase CheR
MDQKDIENLEIELLLSALHRCYGYDFTHYAKASLKRRLQEMLTSMDLQHFSELMPKLLHNRELVTPFVVDLSVTVTEMFRDPAFYIDFRDHVIPILKTYPFIKIWHAGCSTGEEVYSMAILLHEAGLLDRAQLYATDFNRVALKTASQGIYSLRRVPEYTENYCLFSNKASFSDYYHAKYNAIKMRRDLREHITFSHHNLVVDHHFGEMNVILCRNVMIYFDMALQNKVLHLFKDSLIHRGFLCLGNKENLVNTEVYNTFDTVSKTEKIYRLKSEVHHDV